MSLFKTHYVTVTCNFENGILDIRWKNSPSSLQLKLVYTRVQQIIRRYSVRKIVDDQSRLDKIEYKDIHRWFSAYFYPDVQENLIPYQIIPCPFIDYSLFQDPGMPQLQLGVALGE